MLSHGLLHHGQHLFRVAIEVAYERIDLRHQHVHGRNLVR